MTIEVEDVNSSPYFDNVETDLSVIEVSDLRYRQSVPELFVQSSTHVVCV